MTAANREKEQVRELCCLVCLNRLKKAFRLMHICTVLLGLREKKFPKLTWTQRFILESKLTMFSNFCEARQALRLEKTKAAQLSRIAQQQTSQRDVAPRVRAMWPSKTCTSEVVKWQKKCKGCREENLSSVEQLRKHATIHFGYCTLSLSMRGLHETPADLWKFHELGKLNLSNNYLSSLPPGLGNLKNLVVLNIWGNELERLPPEIGLLQNLKVLFAYCNRLSEVPEELGYCTKLEVLSLANNQLTGLPGSLVSMHKLAKLNLSHNRMSHVPNCIYTMKELAFLHMAYNVLENIANQIQELTKLRILIVEGNNIHTLPQTLCHLTQLELLNVDFNDLHILPVEMYMLKNLKRLACHPLDKGLHIVHNPLLKPLQETLQGGLDALYSYLKHAREFVT